MTPVKLDPTPIPDGAAIVRTLPFTVTHKLISDLLPRRGAVEVSGGPGCGKTKAVDEFFASNDVVFVKIHLVSRLTGYGFLRKLISELGGDPRGDGDELIAELRRLVDGRCLYVYIDEADLLNVHSLRQIRYLLDQRDIHIAWVLVGSNFERAYKVCPELRSRVSFRVCFDPLAEAELVAHLAQFHPFLASGESDLLLRIDRQHCHGNWRVWSETLITLLDYAERQGITTLTQALAGQVLGVSAARPRKRRGTRPYPARKV